MAQAAPAASAGGVNEARPAAQAAAAASAGGADPAAAAELRRGTARRGAGFPEVISSFASYELALALTLTGRSAEAYLDFAVELATRLPKTLAALEAGEIDIVRARIIAEATNVLSKEHAAAVEERIFPRAGQQTSGQLRAALGRAVLSADPEAARRAGNKPSATRESCAGVKTLGRLRCAAVICPRRRCWPPISGSRREHVS